MTERVGDSRVHVIVHHADELEEGYYRAYRDFYTWTSIVKASFSHASLKHCLKHFFYTSGWKKFEPIWNMIIQMKQLKLMTPLLEGVLSEVTKRDHSGTIECMPNTDHME